jgi:hypothetical protein
VKSLALPFARWLTSKELGGGASASPSFHMTNPIILDNNVVRVDGPNEKDLVLKNFQEIPDWFIKRLRDAEAARPKGSELRKVASIPTSVVEKWLKEGFDVRKESAQAIVARLSSEDLGAFITGIP